MKEYGHRKGWAEDCLLKICEAEKGSLDSLTVLLNVRSKTCVHFPSYHTTLKQCHFNADSMPVINVKMTLLRHCVATWKKLTRQYNRQKKTVIADF